MMWQWIVSPSFFAVYMVMAKDTSVNSPEESLPFYCVFCNCKMTRNGIITDCSGKGLLIPPTNIDNRTSELYLSKNLISVVRYSQIPGLFNLNILDLSKNKISSIEIGAFRDLTSLTHLYLNGQRITRGLFILQNVFLPGVFTGLVSLKVLHVHNCLTRTEAFTSRIPSEALKELTRLEKLRIDGVVNVTFNEDFHLLKNLSTVVMSGYDGVCTIGYLSRDSFVGLEHLKNLTINKCSIEEIGKGTFWWTQKLEYLDMSWNSELEIYNFGKCLEELKNTSLKILKINAIHDPNRAGTEILRPNLKYLRDINLTEMYMDDNGIEFIDYGVFSMFPNTLKQLYLRRNKLNFGLYLDEAIFNNPNLESLDAGDQELVIRSELSLTHLFGGFNSRHRRSVRVTDLMSFDRVKRSDTNPRLNLKSLICTGSMSRIQLIDFTSTVNNLTFIDLSRNFIPKIQSNAFKGLYALRHLNLSENYIENVMDSAFNGLDSVEILDLRNNLLGFKLRLDVSGNLFSPLVKLRSLNVSRNRITTLGKRVFKFISNLETLDLSDNYIENLDIEMSPLLRLRVLDLHMNRLQSVPSSVRTYLSDLSQYHSVSVDLSSNKLLCNCNNIPFLKWLFRSKVKFENIENYYCSFNDNTVRVFNDTGSEILEQLEKDCKSYLGIIVGSSTGTGIMIAFLVSYLIYSNRWKLRYVYYMAKVKLDSNGGNVGTRDECFPYDVFISYGDSDRSFVVGEMLQNLEDVGGKRLNIRDRDFELGEVIAVNISKAIRTSKKTFLMLSRHFLRNKWCNFELNIARMESVHMKRAVIVIIFLESIPTKLLPLEILDLLRECPNMDLPKETSLRSVFWRRCVEYIEAN